MAFIGLEFHLGACVLTEFDPDGYLTAQVDGLGKDSRVHPYELHHPFGFASRPKDPEVDADGNIIQGKGCTLLVATQGNENHAWVCADPRFVTRFPPLKGGSSVQYCGSPNPSFDTHDGEDGTKTIYVEVGDTAHVITVGFDADGETILSIVHADGMALILQKKKAILRNAAGDAYIELNESGGVLNGNWQVTGDISDQLGRSLSTHIHATGVGPAGPPLPGL